jgi:hypothetical protein
LRWGRARGAPMRWLSLPRGVREALLRQATKRHTGDGPATGKGERYDGSIRHGVQTKPPRLPVLRIGRAPLFWTRLRPLRLLRVAAARLHAGDPAGRNRPARRPGHPPMRLRAPRDAEAARRGVSLPGVPLGGPALRGSSRRRTKKGSPMVGYMSLEEQVDKDFTLARRKASLRRIGDRLRRNSAASEGMPCFEEVRTFLGAVGGVHRGRRTVPSGQIAGSVGRCSDFDRAFLPAR